MRYDGRVAGFHGLFLEKGVFVEPPLTTDCEKTAPALYHDGGGESRADSRVR